MNDKADLTEEIRRLELLLLDPEVRSSAAALNRLLAEDFFEIGASGRVFDRAQIVAALEEDALLETNVQDLEVRPLFPDIALATYKLRSRTAGSKTDRFSLRSSLWVYRGDRWQLRFHQGTPAALSS